MSRDAISITIPDLSQFAKSLRAGLQQVETVPTHLGLLGQIAKAAGYQNYQHLKANHEGKPAQAAKVAAPLSTASRARERAMRVFDADGVMARWPKQASARMLCLWALWAQIPANTELSEPQVNDLLKTAADFGDHVLLRRSLIDFGLASRTADGSRYRRIEQAPPADAVAFIRDITSRRTVLT